MTKLKAIVSAFGLVAIITAGYLIGRVLQPVKIIALHEGSEILVNTFPLTDRGKIDWWIKNQSFLMEKYHFPKITEYTGNYMVIIWDFGDGYKKAPYSEKSSDLACFNDMTTDVNCIEKKSYMKISHYDGGKTKYVIRGGETYLQQYEGGKIVRIKSIYD